MQFPQIINAVNWFRCMVFYVIKSQVATVNVGICCLHEPVNCSCGFTAFSVTLWIWGEQVRLVFTVMPRHFRLGLFCTMVSPTCTCRMLFMHFMGRSTISVFELGKLACDFHISSHPLCNLVYFVLDQVLQALLHRHETSNKISIFDYVLISDIRKSGTIIQFKEKL